MVVVVVRVDELGVVVGLSVVTRVLKTVGATLKRNKIPAKRMMRTITGMIYTGLQNETLLRGLDLVYYSRRL